MQGQKLNGIGIMWSRLALKVIQIRCGWQSWYWWLWGLQGQGASLIMHLKRQWKELKASGGLSRLYHMTKHNQPWRMSNLLTDLVPASVIAMSTTAPPTSKTKGRNPGKQGKASQEPLQRSTSTYKRKTTDESQSTRVVTCHHCRLQGLYQTTCELNPIRSWAAKINDWEGTKDEFENSSSKMSLKMLVRMRKKMKCNRMKAES